MTKLAQPVVLIAEDECLIRMAAVEAFLHGGFDVVEAGDAAEALSLYEPDAPFQLLFTDINMPGELNGIDLAESFLERAPRLQIIITSALPIIRSVEHLRATFISKPYNALAVSKAARALFVA